MMKRLSTTLDAPWRAAAAAALLAASMAAHAEPTPLGGAVFRLIAEGLQQASAGSLTFSGCTRAPALAGWSGACGNVTSSVAYGSGKGEATVQGSFLATAGNANGFGGSAQLWFDVVVDGPCISDGDGGCLSIPVITTASGSATAVGTWAWANIRAPGGGFDACSGFLLNVDGIEHHNCGDTPESFGGNIYGSMQPGRKETITMDAGGGGNNYVYTNASFYAQVDPMIVIDPRFSFASLYTLSVSPGSTGTGDTGGTLPEPGTLSLLSLALLAGIARRASAPGGRRDGGDRGWICRTTQPAG